jgi:hypothetical protein
MRRDHIIIRPSSCEEGQTPDIFSHEVNPITTQKILKSQRPSILTVSSHCRGYFSRICAYTRLPTLLGLPPSCYTYIHTCVRVCVYVCVCVCVCIGLHHAVPRNVCKKVSGKRDLQPVYMRQKRLVNMVKETYILHTWGKRDLQTCVQDTLSVHGRVHCPLARESISQLYWRRGEKVTLDTS